MKSSVLILFLIVLLMVSCKSENKIVSKNENIVENPVSKTINYICVVEEKTNPNLTFELIDSRVKTLISYYISGLDFEILKNNEIKIINSKTLSYNEYLINNKKREVIELNNKKYYFERGTISFDFLSFKNVKNVVSIKITDNGEDFWLTYNSLMIKAIKKVQPGKTKGKIVPIDDLTVKSIQSGKFELTGEFKIYTF